MTLVGEIIAVIIVNALLFIIIFLAISLLLHPLKKITRWGYYTKRSSISDEIFFFANVSFFQIIVFETIFVVPLCEIMCYYLIFSGKVIFFILAIITMCIGLIIAHVINEFKLKKFLSKINGIFENKDKDEKKVSE